MIDLSELRVMILAAGRGERMRPLTDTVPKPMLQAGGKPLIVWHLERLAAWGVKQVVINHAHLGHVLQAGLGDGSRWNVKITWSAEQEALETAGGITLALPHLGDQPFLVINGDVFCQLHPQQVARALQALRSGRLRADDAGCQPVDVFAWLIDNPPHHPQGDFTLLPDGCVHAQADPSQGLAMTFSGLALYRPSFFKDCTPGQKAPLAPLLRQAMQSRAVLGERLDGLWVDVGTPQRLAELDAMLWAQQTGVTGDQTCMRT